MAQAQSQRLEVISIEQGLSQGFIPSICQDDEGFLWFATINGLNRYDGYDFEIFKNDPYDSLSLPNNRLHWIVDSGPWILVTFIYGEIALFDRKTRSFFSISLPENLKNSDYLQPVWQNDHCFWLFPATESTNSVWRFNWSNQPVLQARNSKLDQPLIQIDSFTFSENINNFCISQNKNTLYTLGNQYLWIRDIEKNSIKKIALDQEPGPLKTLIFENENKIGYFSPDFFYELENDRWTIRKFDFQFDRILNLDKKNKIIWLIAQNKLLGFEITNFSEIIKISDANYKIEVSEGIESVFTDNNGNIWIGTNARGIRKFNPKASVFKHFLENHSIYCAPLYNQKGFIGLADVRPDNLKGGILNTKTGHFESGSSWNWPFFGLQTGAMDKNENFWFYRYLLGKNNYSELLMMDPETKAKQLFPIAFAPYTNPIVRFDHQQNLIITDGRKLIIFDINLKKYQTRQILSPPGDWEVICAELDKQGNIWLGTNIGLLFAQLNNDIYSTKLIQNEPNNRNSLPGNTIKSVLLDPTDPNRLWVGLAGQGLCRLDISKHQFHNLNIRHGLADDVIYGILPDEESPGNLWLSTNRGLTRFTPSSGQFQYYFKSDGLQDDEFNTHAAAKGADGTLLFGGVNGLTIFNPKYLTVNIQPPKIFFSKIQINGKNIYKNDSLHILDFDLAFAQTINLKHNQNNIQLSFASSDFTNPKRNQFAYYLKGAESEWQHRGFDHSVQYLNLRPGTYIFYVKGTNSDGIWSEPSALTIKIRPPWYTSNWAFFFYSLLISGSGYLFFKNREYRKLERREALRLKELDEFKSRFFTNISHEFRTPLTVILGLTEKVMDTLGNQVTPIQLLSLIKRNGENLLRLINQILDLAKLENHSLQLELVHGDILPVLRYLSESLQSLAATKSVSLQLVCADQEILMDHDPERIQQIIYNLLSNAIKFTPPNGSVIMSARIDTLDSKPILKLSVKDTGCGIPQEDLPKIFNRFFQAKNQENFAGGSGIGLALTKELVETMNGQIAVSSTEGKGTDFTLYLPISHQAKSKAPTLVASPIGQLFTDKLLELEQNANAPLLLIIEDSTDVITYLSLCLHQHYRLEIAVDGLSGVEKAIELVPDLIVSDVMMPAMNGFEVCETLKNDQRTSHIPIILLTAKATIEDRISGVRRGADAYLSKPFRQDELLVWAEQLIAGRRKLQQRYANPDYIQTIADSVIIEEETAIEDAFMIRLFAVLEENYSDFQLNVDMLSRQMLMSRSQLHRKITALTNKSSTEWINSFRLEKAYTYLQEGKGNVAEAAFACGFNDPKYFTRLFSEYFGTPPSELKKV